MRGGRLVARALAERRVANAFTLCGDHISSILEGCEDEGVRLIDARHEAGAGFMAEGWSLATGDPGVLIVTGGPGLTNALTPIADAGMAGVPLVVITGAIRQTERGLGYPQDVDHAAAVAPFAVWSHTVSTAEAIPDGIAEAFSRARTARGPVLLEVPLDVQLAETPEVDTLDAERLVAPVLRGTDHLMRMAAVLQDAERPVVIAGEGAFWSDRMESLRHLAATCGIPVFTLRAARGLLEDRHHLSFGQPNFLSPLGQRAFSRADVVVVVGTDLDIVLGFGNLFSQAKLIRIDADEVRVRRPREPEVAFVGDEAAGMEHLANHVGALRTAPWLAELGDAAESAPPPASGDGDPGKPAHPLRLVEAVAGSVHGPATFSVDAGELALWALGGLPATGPGRLLTSFATPMATLGGGVPFAIAAKLARPDEASIALVGDGSFGLSAMEVDTAVRHGIDITVVIGNDAAWGIVKRQSEMGFGRSVAADLPGARYDLIAEGLGARGLRVETLAELPGALEAAVRHPGAAVLDVAIDPHPVHPAMPFIAAMFAPSG